MNYVVYQAYGKIEILHECLYSVATLWKYAKPENLTIVIFTDQPDWFTQYITDTQGIILIQITPEQIQQWRGEINFVHRVKIEILLQASVILSGNILYLDTDTFFLSSPEPLFSIIGSGGKIMHLKEDILSKSKLPLNKKIFRYVRGKTFMLSSRTISIDGHLGMWNAGALGFHTQEVDLLKEILQLTDLLYRGYAKHTMEQLAFSVIFQLSGKISAAEDIVFHYWDFKQFRNTLALFWAENHSLEWEAVCVLSQKIKPEAKIRQEREFKQKPYWLRKILQWSGKGSSFRFR